jgi:hypothetical protein
MYCILFCNNCMRNNANNINHTHKLFGAHIIYIKSLYLPDNASWHGCFGCRDFIRYDYCDDFCFKLVLVCNINTIIPHTKKKSISCILGETYYPYHFTTLKKFNIEMTSNTLKNICKYIYMNGKFDEFISLYNRGLQLTSFDFTWVYGYFNDKNILKNLDLLKNFGIIIKDYDRLLLEASSKNNIHVLNWFYKNNYSMKGYSSIISNASKHGHVDILTWWFNSGLEFNYDSNAIDNASLNGHLHVLEWWLNNSRSNNRLKLIYTSNAMDTINIDVLNWWKNSGLTLKYRSDILVDKSACTMESCMLKRYYDVGILYMPKPIEVVKWWLNSGLPIENHKSHLFFHILQLQSYSLSDLECLFKTALQLKMNNKI